HPFAEGELARVLRDAEGAGCELVVTTEKDAVRLPALAAADPRLRAVRIEAEVLRGGAGLDAALDAALGGRSAAGPASAGDGIGR
ncbi:MAG TPA: tetraacyldisaccharide 4'-kinase, partial [Anaeromyxobacter sp.]